jgi:hypothetical protein
MTTGKREWKVEFTDRALRDIASAPDDIKKELTKAIKKIQKNPYAGEQVSGRRSKSRQQQKKITAKCDIKGCPNKAYRDVYWITDQETRHKVGKYILSAVRKANMVRRMSSRGESHMQRCEGSRIMHEGKLEVAWNRLCRKHFDQERDDFALLWWHHVT